MQQGTDNVPSLSLYTKPKDPNTLINAFPMNVSFQVGSSDREELVPEQYSIKQTEVVVQI